MWSTSDSCIFTCAEKKTASLSPTSASRAAVYNSRLAGPQLQTAHFSLAGAHACTGETRLR